MSANIEFNKKKGSFSFVGAVKPAWHRLGTILPSRFTSAEAIEYANLDFEVGLAPAFAKVPELYNPDNPFAEYTPMDGKFITYRKDLRTTFGIVGSKYEVVQNKEAFSFFDTIVGEHKAIYESAGALGNGETIFLTAKLPDNIVLPGDDIIDKYLVFSMSHDGSRPVTAMFTPTRVVCANTLAVAMANGTHKVVIKHTASAHDRITEAAKLMGLVQKSTYEISETIIAMAKKSITEEKLVDYIKLVFLTPEERKALALNGGNHKNASISDTTIGKMESVYEYTHSGVGQDTPSTMGTLFGAYSGVTSWLFNSKEYRNDENRFNSLILEGADYKLNNHAYRVAAELVNKW